MHSGTRTRCHFGATGNHWRAFEKSNHKIDMLRFTRSRRQLNITAHKVCMWHEMRCCCSVINACNLVCRLDVAAQVHAQFANRNGNMIYWAVAVARLNEHNFSTQSEVSEIEFELRTGQCKTLAQMDTLSIWSIFVENYEHSHNLRHLEWVELFIIGHQLLCLTSPKVITVIWIRPTLKWAAVAMGEMALVWNGFISAKRNLKWRGH